ncbi:MAG: type VI secretion system contractile sheath domain-containing protein [Escherichia coli]
MIHRKFIQSGLYRHTHRFRNMIRQQNPCSGLISSYEFDKYPQDIALLRNISRVSACLRLYRLAGPKFFLKNFTEEVAAIKDIATTLTAPNILEWKPFRDTDDSRYVGLVMPCAGGRLPYGPDTVPVRSFNYVEEVKGPDHESTCEQNQLVRLCRQGEELCE